MKSKFMSLLEFIAFEMVENDLSIDEAILRMNDQITPAQLGDTGKPCDVTVLKDKDLDVIKTFITYLLIEGAHLDSEDIYAIIFGNGKRILWN